MLRRLILLRHAKSSLATPGIADHERPLERKGIDDAHRVAKKLAQLHPQPELVLCSDAQRTRETWEHVSNCFDSDTSVVESHSLYESGVSAYVEVMNSQNFDGKCLMIIGHNPTIEHFIYIYTGKGLEMSPAYAAVLEIRADSWKEALENKGLWELVDIVKC